MKDDKDQIIQKMLEQGLKASSSEDQAPEQDLKAYEMLFAALKEEPELELSADFAKVVRVRVEKAEYKISFKFHFLPLLVSITAFAVAFSLLFLISPQTGTLVLHTAIQYKWIIMSAFLLVFSVQYFDQKLTKDLIGSGRAY